MPGLPVPYVLAVDQQAGRGNPDRVGAVLRELNNAVPTLLAFERTAGTSSRGCSPTPTRSSTSSCGWSGPGTGASASAPARSRRHCRRAPAPVRARPT